MILPFKNRPSEQNKSTNVDFNGNNVEEAQSPLLSSINNGGYENNGRIFTRSFEIRGIKAPVYDITDGYPKNIPDGPQIIASIGRKPKLINGVPYEELDSEIQKDLDERPTDADGNLRIFVEDTFYGLGHYVEFGNPASSLFMKNLQSQGNKLL